MSTRATIRLKNNLNDEEKQYIVFCDGYYRSTGKYLQDAIKDTNNYIDLKDKIAALPESREEPIETEHDFIDCTYLVEYNGGSTRLYFSDGIKLVRTV